MANIVSRLSRILVDGDPLRDFWPNTVNNMNTLKQTHMAHTNGSDLHKGNVLIVHLSFMSHYRFKRPIWLGVGLLKTYHASKWVHVHFKILPIKKSMLELRTMAYKRIMYKHAFLRMGVQLRKLLLTKICQISHPHM